MEKNENTGKCVSTVICDEIIDYIWEHKGVINMEIVEDEHKSRLSELKRSNFQCDRVKGDTCGGCILKN